MELHLAHFGRVSTRFDASIVSPVQMLNPTLYRLEPWAHYSRLEPMLMSLLVLTEIVTKTPALVALPSCVEEVSWSSSLYVVWHTCNWLVSFYLICTYTAMRCHAPNFLWPCNVISSIVIFSLLYSPYCNSTTFFYRNSEYFGRHSTPCHHNPKAFSWSSHVINGGDQPVDIPQCELRVLIYPWVSSSCRS